LCEENVEISLGFVSLPKC